ncbi:MAG: hypothetical protein ING71_17305 [Rhodocyclaceae bacterium]|nr:hypothetical protein [Rhodocyclaceae bacterium]
MFQFLIPAALQAIGSSYSASQQSKAAKRSAQAAQSATDQNIAEQRRQYDQTRQDWLPFQRSDLARRRMADRSYGIQSSDMMGQQSVYDDNAGQIDYGSYVRSNPDLMADFQASGGQYGGIEDFGQIHYDNYGRGEGRQLPLFQSQQTQQPQGQPSGQPFDPLSDFNASGDRAILDFQPILDATNAQFAAKGAALDGSAIKAVRDRSTNYVRNAFLDWRSGLEGSPTGANNALSNAGQQMASNNSNARTANANALASSYQQRGQANASGVGAVLGAGNWFANQSGILNQTPTGQAPTSGWNTWRNTGSSGSAPRGFI